MLSGFPRTGCHTMRIARDSSVPNITSDWTYNRTCDFHRIRLKQAPRACGQAEVLGPLASPTCRRWHWAWMRRSLVSAGVPSARMVR